MTGDVPLIAVAHGSRDPRSAATISALADVLRMRAPELDVRVAFLDLSAPRLTDVLDAVHAEGHPRAVVVPLLLGKAYHARVDIPAMVHAAARPRFTIEVADVLGPDPRLETVALQRLHAAGLTRGDGILLAGAGSSHESANAAVRTVAAELGAVAAFASAGSPKAAEAVAQLRAKGARRIAVGSWFLAPGRLPDRIEAEVRRLDPEAVIAEPLGPHDLLADVVLDRYAEALTAQRAQRYA